MEENSKILIAADNELFYPSCITYFEGLGISVEHKDDGLAALNCVKTEKYEFIIAETQPVSYTHLTLPTIYSV